MAPSREAHGDGAVVIPLYDIPTSAKPLVKILDEIESGVRKNASVSQLRRECDDLISFILKYENDSTKETVITQIISEIMELFSSLMKKMKKWARAVKFTPAAIIEREIKQCHTMVSEAKERFKNTYSVDIVRLIREKNMGGPSSGTNLPTGPPIIQGQTSMDQRDLNPTISRISARRKSSMSNTFNPYPSTPVRKKNSDMASPVGQMPPSPTRMKRKTSDDDIYNKRRRTSDQSFSPVHDNSPDDSPISRGPNRGFRRPSPVATAKSSDSYSSISSTSSTPSAPTSVISLLSPHIFKNGGTHKTMARSPAAEDEVEKTLRKQLRIHEEDFHNVYSDLDILATAKSVETGTARRLADKMLVAVKRINIRRIHPSVLHRFIEEFNYTHSRQHRNLVNYIGSFLHNTGLLVIMDHTSKAVSLREVIDVQSSPMSEQQIASVLRNVTHAVVHLHQNRVLHGRIDSRNIILSTDYDVSIRLNLCAMLADHEIPEHPVAGSVDAAVDVWNLGIVAIEMLDKSVRDLTPRRFEPLKRIASIEPQPSSNMHHFLTRALERDVRRRATAEELLKSSFLETGTSLFSLRCPIMDARRIFKKTTL